MTAEETRSAELIRAVVADVRDAYTRAREILTQERDPHRAFELATRFADDLRLVADKAADLRAAAVGRIWDSEATSLAGLAQKIGVSKARAAQLMQTARSVAERAQQNDDERQR